MKLVIIALLIMLTSQTAAALDVKDLGVTGEIYPVMEQDLIKAIESRISSFDMEAFISEHYEASVKKASTANVPLGVAKDNSTKKFARYHTLEEEIFVYESGIKRVLYPKGYSYNVLEYLTLDESYVVINGTRDVEIEWFIENQGSFFNPVLIISEGSALELIEKLGIQVYILNSYMKKVLNIEKTPSVIVQEGNMLRLDETALPEVTK